MLDLCRQLAQEGVPHSAGQFSLDLAKARAHLSHQLFSHPANYLLKFFQYAVSHEPPEVWLQHRGSDLQISFSSDQSLNPSQLEHIRDHLWDASLPQESPAQRDLVLALWAAQSLLPEGIILACRTPQAGAALLIHQGQLSLSEIPAGPTLQALVLRRSPRPWWRAWLGPSQELSQDLAALRDRVRYSWCPLRLQGKALEPRPLKISGLGLTTLAERLYLSRSPLPQLLALGSLSRRPALMYDVHGRLLNLDTAGQTLLHQWRSYRTPEPPQLPLFEPTPAPDSPPDTSGLWNPSGSSGFCLYRGLYRTNRGAKPDPMQIIRVPFQGLSCSLHKPEGLFATRETWPAALMQIFCPTRPQGEESRLHICQNGILLEPVRLYLKLKGLEIVVADPTMVCDLAGLQPRQGERLTALCNWIRLEVEGLASDVRKAMRFNEGLGLSDSQVKYLSQIHSL